MSKRVPSFILAALLCGSALISCGESAPSSPAPEAEQQNEAPDGAAEETQPETTEMSDGLPEDLDFGGYTFRWLTSATNSNNTITVYNEQTGDVLNDAM